MLVDAELDLSTLDLRNGLGRVGGDGSGLRVRHKATRTKHLTQTADLTHELGGRDSSVERRVAGRNLLDELVATNLVGASSKCCFSRGARCEDDDAGGLTGSVRKNHGTADHLVCLAGVDTKLEGNLNGRVELLRTGLACNRDSLGGGVNLALFDLLGSGPVGLGFLCHVYLLN